MTLQSKRKSFTVKLSTTRHYTAPVTLLPVVTSACRHVAAWFRMARMTSRPGIGALIRDAMERKRMDQAELATALGVSRSAVNSWINDRAWPMNSIAALEDLLGIKLPREAESTPDEIGPPVDETDRQLMSIPNLPPELQDVFRRMYRESLQGRRRAG